MPADVVTKEVTTNATYVACPKRMSGRNMSHADLAEHFAGDGFDVEFWPFGGKEDARPDNESEVFRGRFRAVRDWIPQRKPNAPEQETTSWTMFGRLQIGEAWYNANMIRTFRRQRGCRVVRISLFIQP